MEWEVIGLIILGIWTCGFLVGYKARMLDEKFGKKKRDGEEK